MVWSPKKRSYDLLWMLWFDEKSISNVGISSTTTLKKMCPLTFSCVASCSAMQCGIWFWLQWHSALDKSRPHLCKKNDALAACATIICIIHIYAVSVLQAWHSSHISIALVSDPRSGIFGFFCQIIFSCSFGHPC